MSGKGKGKGKGGKAPTSRKAPQSRTKRAGLHFPVGRIHSKLKKRMPRGIRVGATAAVEAAATMQYLCSEYLELAGNAAKDLVKKRITPRHLQLAVRNDEELNKLIGGDTTTIASGGVRPFVHAALLPPTCAKTNTCKVTVSARYGLVDETVIYTQTTRVTNNEHAEMYTLPAQQDANGELLRVFVKGDEGSIVNFYNLQKDAVKSVRVGSKAEEVSLVEGGLIGVRYYTVGYTRQKVEEQQRKKQQRKQQQKNKKKNKKKETKETASRRLAETELTNLNTQRIQTFHNHMEGTLRDLADRTEAPVMQASDAIKKLQIQLGALTEEVRGGKNVSDQLKKLKTEYDGVRAKLKQWMRETLF